MKEMNEMKVVVFHGSPRKGNTYTATQIFLEALCQCGGVSCTEFFLPGDLPDFCLGCQQCLGGPREKCPHAGAVEPVYQAVMAADALIFATPHYGAGAMTGGMKNLLDHLDFFTMTVAPRKEMFSKKAFVLTTASGSTAAAGQIRKALMGWGINRVSSMAIRMFTDRWDHMPARKQQKRERKLRRAARRFRSLKKKPPYLSSVLMYHLNRLIIRRFMGSGSYPCEYWKENGYFDKCPL